MKRKEAFRKVRTVCQRLDGRGEQFPVAPLQLYLFGSLLTDNPAPADIDLLLRYAEPKMTPEEVLEALYGQTPLEKAVKLLRRGMKMIRFEWIGQDLSLEKWLADRLFDADAPMVMLWEPGLDWVPIVDEIEANPPAAWDPDLAAWRKQIQAESRQILKDQGEREAIAWLKEQEYGGRGE